MSIRVLIVEDSAVVRELICHILGSDPAISVVGIAQNGDEALRAVQVLEPDVVTMDISMPVMDGYEATRRIMETHPLPIVIVSVSVSSREVATTFRALEAGALAVVRKPVGVGHPEFDEMAGELIGTVRLMSEVKVVKRWPAKHNSLSGGANCTELHIDKVDVIAMGASAGGPLALQTILSDLPDNLGAPILIVQHIVPGFIHGFAESLSISCRLPVHIPSNQESVMPGHVYLAPDGVQMGIGRDGRIELNHKAATERFCPSISYLFRSVADNIGAKAIGVLLTGMGEDGAKELGLLKNRGAITIAQDEESSIVFGMPGEAIKLGAATCVLSPHKIASLLRELVCDSSHCLEKPVLKSV